MIIKKLLIAYILVLLQPRFAVGYDDQIAHPEITGKAVSDVSNLNAYLKTSLGFSKGLDTHLPSDSTDPNKTILKLLTAGSTAEDSPSCRASNHFHDPLKAWGESGMSDEPWWLNRKCSSWSPWYSDIIWATGQETKGGLTVTRRNQIMGWDNARTYLYNALISGVQTERETNLTKTFQSLGNVLHLLQDMAVPAHVRNDFTSHIAFNGKTSSEFVRWFGNHYEYYVQNHQGTITNQTAQLPSFTNTRLTDFWDTDQYKGITPLKDNSIGLAEFTNANYISDSTIPYTIRSLKHIYTYPKIDDPNIQICIDYEPGSTKKRVYLSRKDRGACPPITEARSADHFAALGLWNDFSVNTIIDAVLNLDLTVLATPVSLDDNVHKTYANDILPRAVGYSAKLLDYFFRGSIEITVPISAPPSSNGVYSMIDATQAGFNPATTKFTTIKLRAKNTTSTNEDMTNGTIELVVKYKTALADPFQGGLVATSADFSYAVVPEKNGISSLSRTAYTELNFDLGQKSIPLWATDVYLQVVYHGKLGNEDGAVAVGFKDISEPTPVDMFNNMDKICINGSWHEAGSPEAIDQVDTTPKDGIADEADVYAHNLNNIYLRFSPYSEVPPYYFALPSVHDVAIDNLYAGDPVRAVYILSDDMVNIGHYMSWVTTDPDDQWIYNDFNRLWWFYTVKRQTDYSEDSGLCGGSPPCYIDVYPEHLDVFPSEITPAFFTFRNTSMWGGSVKILENSPYPDGSTCSYDLL